MASSKETNKKKNEDQNHDEHASHKHRHKNILTRNLHAVGGVLSLLQAGTAALLLYLLNGTGMIPWNYILTAFAVLVLTGRKGVRHA